MDNLTCLFITFIMGAVDTVLESRSPPRQALARFGITKLISIAKLPVVTNDWGPGEANSVAFVTGLLAIAPITVITFPTIAIATIITAFTALAIRRTLGVAYLRVVTRRVCATVCATNIGTFGPAACGEFTAIKAVGVSTGTPDGNVVIRTAPDEGSGNLASCLGWSRFPEACEAPSPCTLAFNAILPVRAGSTNGLTAIRTTRSAMAIRDTARSAGTRVFA